MAPQVLVVLLQHLHNMTIRWITPAGSLSTVVERVSLSIPLEATSNVGAITFSVISGRLPRGVRLDTVVSSDSSIQTVLIKGSPTEVRKFTTNRFVIRANDGVDIEDRTFSIISATQVQFRS